MAFSAAQARTARSGRRARRRPRPQRLVDAPGQVLQLRAAAVEHRRGRAPQVADGHVRRGLDAVVAQPVADLEPRPDDGPAAARPPPAHPAHALDQRHPEEHQQHRPDEGARGRRHDDVPRARQRHRLVVRAAPPRPGAAPAPGRRAARRPGAGRSPSRRRSVPPVRSPRGRRPSGRAAPTRHPPPPPPATRTRRRCAPPARRRARPARAGSRRRGGRGSRPPAPSARTRPRTARWCRSSCR